MGHSLLSMYDASLDYPSTEKDDTEITLCANSDQYPPSRVIIIHSNHLNSLIEDKLKVIDPIRYHWLIFGTGFNWRGNGLRDFRENFPQIVETITTLLSTYHWHGIHIPTPIGQGIGCGSRCTICKDRPLYFTVPPHPNNGLSWEEFLIIDQMISEKISINVTTLNIHELTRIRTDIYLGSYFEWCDYRDCLGDCFHVCRPGILDVWMELVLNHLLTIK